MITTIKQETLGGGANLPIGLHLLEPPLLHLVQLVQLGGASAAPTTPMTTSAPWGPISPTSSGGLAAVHLVLLVHGPVEVWGIGRSDPVRRVRRGESS